MRRAASVSSASQMHPHPHLRQTRYNKSFLETGIQVQIKSCTWAFQRESDFQRYSTELTESALRQLLGSNSTQILYIHTPFREVCHPRLLAFALPQDTVLHLEISALCKKLGRRAGGAGNELSSSPVWQEYPSSKHPLKNTLHKPRAMVL